MPRSRARERAHHAAVAPDCLRAFHALLVAELPHLDRALVGYPAMIAFLDSLSVTRPNGRPVRPRSLQRWRTHHGCPILAGGRQDHRAWAPPFTTTFALTAWVLSRRCSGERDLFFVGYSFAYANQGKPRRGNSRPVSTRAA